MKHTDLSGPSPARSTTGAEDLPAQNTSQDRGLTLFSGEILISTINILIEYFACTKPTGFIKNCICSVTAKSTSRLTKPISTYQELSKCLAEADTKKPSQNTTFYNSQ